MKQITAYQTSDGTIFESERSAKQHETDQAVHIASEKLIQLLDDEFPLECPVNVKDVADFLITERNSVRSILDKLEASISVEI